MCSFTTQKCSAVKGLDYKNNDTNGALLWWVLFHHIYEGFCIMQVLYLFCLFCVGCEDLKEPQGILVKLPMLFVSSNFVLSMFLGVSVITSKSSVQRRKNACHQGQGITASFCRNEVLGQGNIILLPWFIVYSFTMVRGLYYLDQVPHSCTMMP